MGFYWGCFWVVTLTVVPLCLGENVPLSGFMPTHGDAPGDDCPVPPCHGEISREESTIEKSNTEQDDSVMILLTDGNTNTLNNEANIEMPFTVTELPSAGVQTTRRVSETPSTGSFQQEKDDVEDETLLSPSSEYIPSVLQNAVSHPERNPQAASLSISEGELLQTQNLVVDEGPHFEITEVLEPTSLELTTPQLATLSMPEREDLLQPQNLILEDLYPGITKELVDVKTKGKIFQESGILEQATENLIEVTTQRDVAVLSMDRVEADVDSSDQSRALSWDSRPFPPESLYAPFPDPSAEEIPVATTTQLPPLSKTETEEPFHTQSPLPIVTVTSRILSLGRTQTKPDRDENMRGAMAQEIQHRKLEFDPVPAGDRYNTDITHAQPTILAWAGSFVSLLQPSHFPLELVRAALEKRITAEELVTESLQAEPGFIACMVTGLTLSVGVPVLGLFICCCRLCGRCGGKRKQHNHTSCFNCQRRTLTVSLSTISVAVLLGIIVIITGNERLGYAVSEARMSVTNNVRDLDTFMRNTKMQLRYLVSNSLEQTVDAIHGDLDDIEYLLGRPLQRELAAEAQIEVALDSLLHISSNLRGIAGRMRALEESRLQAAARAEELRGRLYDLSQDIRRFVERCTPEDAELCNSLDPQGLELGSRFDRFSFSEQLRHLSAVENHNLTETARHARLEFENIPAYVETVTRNTRDDVKRAVRDYRAQLYTRIRSLDNMAFDLEVQTRDLTWRVDEAAASLQEHEPFRWYIGLSIAVSLALVWTLMTIGLLCGCCSHSTRQAPTERSCISNSAGQTIISSVFFMFVFSGILWGVVVAMFVVGAHAHAFICHPLYEEPNFPTLTHLVDDSGMIFDGPVLSNVLHKNRNVRLDIGRVLSQCKEGGAAYQVFQLKHYFDVEAEISSNAALDLRQALGNLRVNLSHVELLSPEAESHLDTFLRSIRIDLEPYRRELEKPLVRKSLPALAEQMQNVASQLRSVSSSAELFKMVARTRNLVTNTLYPLEKRKEDVTYQVATLDMEVMPLQRQINQSSGHLRTIQYFIHNHGSSLAASKARGYVERILSYPRQYADHVRNSALHHVAPCTPVWNLFDSARGVSCNGIIEPLNALWLATGWCLLLFLPSICISLGLARFYLRMDYDDDTLPLQSNGTGSPSGSQTNVQSAGSSSMWASKNNGGSQAYSSRQQNGHTHW